MEIEALSPIFPSMILGPLFPAAPLPPSSVGCVRAWSGIYRAAGFFFSDLLTVAIGVAGVLGSGADRFSWLSHCLPRSPVGGEIGRCRYLVWRWGGAAMAVVAGVDLGSTESGGS
ncbi:hypothetical protein ACOSP7_005214 [Xanthoceras sorbifolium]